jgi:hypothetical protein
MNSLSIPLCIVLIALIYLILKKPCRCDTTNNDDDEKGWKGHRLVEGNTTVISLFLVWLCGLAAFIIFFILASFDKAPAGRNIIKKWMDLFIMGMNPQSRWWLYPWIKDLSFLVCAALWPLTLSVALVAQVVDPTSLEYGTLPTFRG